MALAVKAGAQDTSRKLSKEQVLKLLTQGDPPARVEYLVQKYGISFPMEADTERELKQAGATQELLDLLRKTAPPPPPAPSPPPPPVLVIHETPGEAEVYVDDQRQGQTSSDGVLKINGLSPAHHKLRVSLEGYRSFEVEVELVAGETNTVVAALQPIEPPAPPPKDVPSAAGAAGTTAADNSSKGNPGSTAVKTPADPNDPLAPREPGIYYLQQTGERRLMRLDPAPAGMPVAKGSSGRGNPWAGLGGGWGGGGKVTWKSTVVGAKAPVRFVEPRPIFYFYFHGADANAYGLSGGNAFLNASSPREFLLVRLDSKKKERDVPPNYTKDALSFDREQIAPGIYKVQPHGEMEPGEYAFIYSGALSGMVTMAGSSLFDFGIDKTK